LSVSPLPLAEENEGNEGNEGNHEEASGSTTGGAAFATTGGATTGATDILYIIQHILYNQEF